MVAVQCEAKCKIGLELAPVLVASLSISMLRCQHELPNKIVLAPCWVTLGRWHCVKSQPQQGIDINARLYLHFLLRLRSLPSDSFRNTQLETLDLSHNEFQVTRSKILLTLYKLKLLLFIKPSLRIKVGKVLYELAFSLFQ